MNRFEVLISITDVHQFSGMVFEMVMKTGTKEKFTELLEVALSEEELQILESIAQSDYPLSLDGKQL